MIKLEELKTKTETELKAIAYDSLAAIEMHQRLLKAIAQILEEKARAN